MRDYLYGLATDRYRGVIAGIIKVSLSLLSFIYGLIVRALIFIYRIKPYRLNCKVISVGNITLGGTGKTSLVEYIARYLKEHGYKVAILSRGYKKTTETMGDEPCMLKANLGDVPVIVDANRIQGAKKAISDYGADTVILDDGFQQWKIKKDLEIAVIDATLAFGNQRLLPRGILREPLSSLSRVDAFILTKTDLNPDTQYIKDFLCRVNPAAQVFESVHRPIGFYKLGEDKEFLNIDKLKGRTVTLFSGIGSPDSFENLIENMGINIGLSFRFPDHYSYRQRDLDKIIKESQDRNINTLITTQKDASRLSQSSVIGHQPSVWVLRIKLEIIKDEEGFRNRLLRVYPA